MDSGILFKKMKTLLSQIMQMIDKINLEISGKSPYQKQLLSDIKLGYANIGGLLLPLNSIEHKILFKEYDLTFIKSFSLLFKNLFSNIDNVFTEFSFRVLIDMGIEKTQILFSREITDEEKDKFKLFLTLSDFGALAINNPIFKSHFENLYKENEKTLNKKEKECLDALLSSIENKDITKHKLQINNSRTFINRFQGHLYSKTKTPDFLDINKFNLLYSWFSHLLHGNVFLVGSIFSKNDNPYQHLLRAHYLLLQVGINFIYNVKEKAESEVNESMINLIIKDFKTLEPEINNFWNKYLKLK